jgi:TatD DNase family protein
LLIDTHCHLNLSEHFPNPESEVDFARSMGVERIVVVGVDLETSQIAIDLADRNDGVYAVVGIHPNHSADFRPSYVDDVRALAVQPKAVAIGEIGLDYHWDFATRSQQALALDCQLDLAREIGAPVVFHCRKAYQDLLDILKARVEGRTGPWLLHCFSGSESDARQAIALDCYFGVDGPLTYKSAGELRDLVRSLPRNRIVVETDAPYLTPVPHRGKPNRPGYVAYVNSMLASLWDVSVEEAGRQTTENALRVFAKLGR